MKTLKSPLEINWPLGVVGWLKSVTNKIHTSSRLPFRVKDTTISSLFLKPINSKDSFDFFYPVK